MADFQSELDTFSHFAMNGFTTPALMGPHGVSETDLGKDAKTGPTVSDVKKVITDPVGAMTGGILGSIFSSRVVAVLLGLILIAGSIYLFKPDAVNSVIEKAATVAA